MERNEDYLSGPQTEGNAEQLSVGLQIEESPEIMYNMLTQESMELDLYTGQYTDFIPVTEDLLSSVEGFHFGPQERIQDGDVQKEYITALDGENHELLTGFSTDTFDSNQETFVNDELQTETNTISGKIFSEFRQKL